MSEGTNTTTLWKGGLTLILAAMFIWFLVYLLKLEKTGCKCALTWRRQFIIVYIIVVLTYNVFLIGYPKLGQHVVVMLTMTIMLLMFIVFTLQYITELKRTKCECSEDSARTVLQYYAILTAIVMGIALLTLIAIFASIKRSSYKDIIGSSKKRMSAKTA